MLPTKEALQEGTVLLIDKPLTWTSFDVVNKIRRNIHTKIGHAGTLDPLATGLLICCTGKMTKQITNYQKQAKEYTGIIQLGASTPTFDLESELEHHKDYAHITQEFVEETKQQFIGDIMQMPPIHSAIKKDGKPIYLMARAGKEVKIEPRPLLITNFETCLNDNGEIHFKVNCSTGTYIRSLANDLGTALGVGGYLKALRRTKIGEFDVDEAQKLETFIPYLESLKIERKKKK